MKNILYLFFFCPFIFSCADDEATAKLDILFNISEEQFAKHELFRQVISDIDTFGQNGESLDSFMVQIITLDNEVSDSVHIDAFGGIDVLVGDILILENERLSFLNSADLIELGLDDFGESFNYLVFRKYDGDYFSAANVYADIDSISLRDGFMQLEIPAFNPEVTLELHAF
jgi:hypothetical protein